MYPQEHYRTESSGDTIKLHIDDVFPLEDARNRFLQSVKIIFDEKNHGAEKISSLKKILERNKGNTPLYLHLASNGSKPRLFFLKDFRIKMTNEFINSVTELLGEDSISLGKK